MLQGPEWTSICLVLHALHCGRECKLSILSRPPTQRQVVHTIADIVGFHSAAYPKMLLICRACGVLMLCVKTWRRHAGNTNQAPSATRYDSIAWSLSSARTTGHTTMTRELGKGRGKHIAHTPHRTRTLVPEVGTLAHAVALAA